ncbi:MAG: hypothetical protein ACW99G_20365 [Candidatus Thorarchaeota archaeon]|jgi:hypothetical protein
MSIQIRFVSYQYNRWKRAIDRLRKIALIQENELPRRMSIDYVDLIRKNIYTGKYNATYPRYNQRYMWWKYLVMHSVGSFWYLRGELVLSLRSRKAKRGWFGGIPEGVLDSGNVSWLGKGDRGRRIPIAQYAHWMEYGRAGQPPRPLFRPTLIEYSQGKALVRLKEVRNMLIGAWR